MDNFTINIPIYTLVPPAQNQKNSTDSKIEKSLKKIKQAFNFGFTATAFRDLDYLYQQYPDNKLILAIKDEFNKRIQFG